MAIPPYDIAMTVLNAAKVRLNDKIETLSAIGGKLLDNTQPFTQQVFNGGWRKLQEYLADLGYTGLKQEITFTAVPAAASIDPALQVWISYAGYWDGVGLQAAPLLPQNLIRPYKIWERANGSAALMTEMDMVLNGLPAVPKLNWNRQWEWRDDVLYMPGSLVVTDIRSRYAGALLDMSDVAGSPGINQLANTPWYGQPVPIMRCVDSLADYLCREVCVARGDMDGATAFQASAEANARKILNRDTADPKAVYKASELGKMADRFTPGSGADPQLVKR